MSQQQIGEGLVNARESYQQEYNQKCTEWRSEPVEQRRLNDRCCVVTFFIIFLAFIGAGTYFIIKLNNRYVNQPVTIGDIDTDSFLKAYAGQILGCFGIAIVLSFLFIFLIKLCPKVMVYSLITLTFIVMLGFIILGFVVDVIALSIMVGITLIIYAIVLFCFRKQLQVGIVLVKVASTFITDKPTVFIAPLIKIVLTVLISVFWVYSIVGIYTMAFDQNAKNQSTIFERVCIGAWVIMYLFMSFLFYYMMVFTVAVAVAFWYYRVDKNFFTTAYRWIATSSFGSLVFAALLISLITFARMLVNDSRRGRTNPAAAVCLCILSCILKSIEELVKVLNHYSVIVMAVTGESYIDSAKTTIGILSRNLALLAVTSIVGTFLVFWGVLIVSGLTGLFGYLMVAKQSPDDVTGVMLIVILSSIMFSSLILSVLIESVSAIYIFYCFDTHFKELGFNTHNMPDDIAQAITNFNINDEAK